MKGIALGLTYQVVVAVGFVWIAGIAPTASPIAKANVMLFVAGACAAVFLCAWFVFGEKNPTTFLGANEILRLGVAAVLVLVVGEAVYLSGLAASNATTMAYTALAFPAVSLALDIALRRITLSSLSLRDGIAVALLTVGFILLASRTHELNP